MAASDLVVSPVESRLALDAFIQLPKRLYGGNPGYAAPLDLERREAFRAESNPLFRHVEARFFLAQRAGRDVGRIVAMVNRSHLDHHNDATGHFGCLAAEDDPEIFAALFAAAEAWLAGHGLKRAVGPLSLTINEEAGVLVEGFDRPAMLLSSWDPPYLAGRVEACGYAGCKDLVSYTYDVAHSGPTAGSRILKHSGMAGRVRIRTANMKMFAAEFRTLGSIFNDAWSESWGFVPLGEAEIDHIAEVLRPLITPDFLVFVEVDDEAVAFVLALANLAEASADLDGRLGFVGLLKLVWRLKFGGVSTVRVPLMGVRTKYRNHPLLGAGLAMVAMERLRETGQRLGKTVAELGPVMDDNKATHSMIRAAGGVPSRRHRLYAKALA